MTVSTNRTMGLAGATGVGVGAIVGGGILALAGVAFATSGPGAILAFALNGLIAVMTAFSFAELSTRFPESGGTYTFAKKVLSVEAAFAVGWVVWFASIVAAVLYAIGFAAFAIVIIESIWMVAASEAPAWLRGRLAETLVACAGTLVFAVGLARRGGGGAPWINIGKLVVFAILIAGGLWALIGSPAGTIERGMRPFLTQGGLGLITAMGFTFIALQGFDLIAAVAGEVRDPERTLPRAMLLSLGIALLIYLPLLFVIATVGTFPDEPVGALARREPETIVAVAAGNFLGPFGFWLVVAAAVLSMLSALQANLYAASRVALAMARDRTLPSVIDHVHARRGTPVRSVVVTTVIVVSILALIPDVAAAGAAASLIFLVTFALAQGIAIMARRRVTAPIHVFRTPLFPLLPVTGGVLCFALAVFQAISVPSAGRIAGVWLGVGGLLFFTLFARRARARDAGSEARDPHLLRLRGRRPLVLVPIANPAHARAMVEVANALAAPGLGRVLLLNVVRGHDDDDRSGVEQALTDAQAVLRESLLAAFGAGLAPEALTTVARSVWPEIARVARIHQCESLLLGLSRLDEEGPGRPLERLIGVVASDSVILRSAPGWSLSNVRRVLVAVGGAGHHDVLRSRLIGMLSRSSECAITYLRVVPPSLTGSGRSKAHRVVHRIAADEARGHATVEVVESTNAADAITEHALAHDLVILGLQRQGRRQRFFGTVATEIAQRTSCAIIMISARG